MTKTFLAAALMIAGSAVLSAQSMVADIPFAFHVPGKQMAAGKYRIERSTATVNYDGFMFRPVDSTKSHYVGAPVRKSSGSKIADSKLVFRCAGDQCELAEIQNSTMQVRLGVTPSMKKNQGVTGTEIATRIIEINVSTD